MALQGVRIWGTWLRMERTAHCQLQRQDSVGIPMAYPIAPTIERPNIILRSRPSTREVTLRRCSSWHL